jgi:imidazolonepropionase-like amidohydrolase
LPSTQKGLIDANGVIENPVIMVEEGKIVDVGSKSKVKPPNDAEEIDARGLTLIPGLIDCHIHLYGRADMQGLPKEPNEVRLFRAVAEHCKQITDSGFTSVMETGS